MRMRDACACARACAQMMRFRLFNNSRIAIELPKKLYGPWQYAIACQTRHLAPHFASHAPQSALEWQETGSAQ